MNEQETKQAQPYYGFYSRQADERSGHFVYKTPSGETAVVTHITKDKTGKGYLWPDKVFVGEVVDYGDGGFVSSTVKQQSYTADYERPDMRPWRPK